MRVRVLVVTSLFTMVAVGAAIGACGDQTQTFIIEDCGPQLPDGGYNCDSGTTEDAGDAGEGGDADDGGDAMSLCPGTCVPVPDDWSDTRLLWIGPEDQAPATCPPQAPTLAYTGHSGLHADPLQCDPCACDPPSGTCSPPETFTAHSAICAQGGIDTSFDPPGSWNGSCTSANSIDAGAECPENSGNPCVQSVTVGKLVMTESACKPSFQPPPKLLTAPTWDLYGLACESDTPAPKCSDPSDRCLSTDPLPPGYLQCVYHRGEVAVCPPAFPYRTVLYGNYDDSRHCTPCGCGNPEGSMCLGMATMYRDPACTEPIAFLTVSSDKAPCGDIVPPGAALGSKTITALSYTPGSCQPTGGDPTGAAIAIEPRTFCCMAA